MGLFVLLLLVAFDNLVVREDARTVIMYVRFVKHGTHGQPS